MTTPTPPLLFYPGDPATSSYRDDYGRQHNAAHRDAQQRQDDALSPNLRLTLAEEHLHHRLEQVQEDNLTEQRKSQLLERRSRLMETEISRMKTSQREQAERAERELKGSRVTFEHLLEERKLELVAKEREVAVLEKNLQALAAEKTQNEDDKKHELAWYQQVLTAREHALQELLAAFDKGLKSQQEGERRTEFFEKRCAVLEAEGAAASARSKEASEHVAELQRLVGNQKKIVGGLETKLEAGETKIAELEEQIGEHDKRVMMLLREKEEMRQTALAAEKELQVQHLEME